MKSLIDLESAKAYINFLKSSGFPYTLKITNYTTELISDLYHVQFCKSMQSFRCFAAYSKLKKDVKDKSVPVVDRADLRYFEHDYRGEVSAPYIINIDLKSAYASVLFIEGIISKDTYRYLQSIPKMDRLASVGMLASRKHIFDFGKDGSIDQYNFTVSPLENFFYYAVKRTGEIMTEIRHILGNDYVFTWVDGIYFLPTTDNKLHDVANYLLSIGLNWEPCILHSFRISMCNKKISLQFWKSDKTKNGFDCYKKKIFNIPSKENIFASDIINYLTNINLNNEKINRSKNPGKRHS